MHSFSRCNLLAVNQLYSRTTTGPLRHQPHIANSELKKVFKINGFRAKSSAKWSERRLENHAQDSCFARAPGVRAPTPRASSADGSTPIHALATGGYAEAMQADSL